MHFPPLRPAVAALAVLLIAGTAGPSAHAGEPLDGGLSYSGGLVMRAPTTYAIFWLPYGRDYGWQPPDAVPYEQLVERYLADVGGTPFYGTLTQYSPSADAPIENRSGFGGAAVDAHPYGRAGTAGDPVRDEDVRAEIVRITREKGWQIGRSSAFFVFLAAGIQACRQPDRPATCTFGSENGVCSWHSAFSEGGNPVIYAVMPYVAGVPGCLPASSTMSAPSGDEATDGEASFVSHEQFEMVTDPLGDGWRDAAGAEIADKCQGNFGAVANEGYNVVLHGAPYLLQAEWSNTDGRCVLGGGTVTPAASPVPASPSQTASPVPAATSPAVAAGEPVAVTRSVHPEPCPEDRRAIRGLVCTAPDAGSIDPR